MFKRKTRRSRKFKKDNQVIDFEAAREERRKKREALAKKTPPKDARKNEVHSKRKLSKKNRSRTVYAAILLIIVAVVGVSAFNIISVRIQKTEELARQKALLNKKQALSEELSSVDNPEYVEQQARMLLRMIKPGEILYVVPIQPKTSSEAGITSRAGIGQ